MENISRLAPAARAKGAINIPAEEIAFRYLLGSLLLLLIFRHLSGARASVNAEAAFVVPDVSHRSY